MNLEDSTPMLQLTSDYILETFHDYSTCNYVINTYIIGVYIISTLNRCRISTRIHAISRLTCTHFHAHTLALLKCNLNFSNHTMSSTYCYSFYH